MTLPVTTKIKLQYNGGCRNTYFETNRGGRNDEQNKTNEVKIKWAYLVYKFYDSSCLFKPSGSNISNVPVKSIKKDSLAFLIESRVSVGLVACQCSSDLDAKENSRRQWWV